MRGFSVQRVNFVFREYFRFSKRNFARTCIESAKMTTPHRATLKEVDIRKLVIGEKYYAFSVHSYHRYDRAKSTFRGTFMGYYSNSMGYLMVKFNNVCYREGTLTSYTGTPEESPGGLWWRVWEDHLAPQSYKYYKASRFSKFEVNEIKTRLVLRERRQYERGLTGSTPDNLWFPRDLVREISLKYLTDPTIGCNGQWR
jgi:hypothetical protein